MMRRPVTSVRQLRTRAAACAVALAGAACAAALAGGPAVARSSGALPSSARGLDVLPFPGTPDAAPGTNVDFPAVSPSQIASVHVVGSRSGVHAGHLSAQPDHAGTAFSPDGPFAAGERVSVTAMLRSAAAGTASGAPGARRLSFSFSVARPASVTAAEVASGPDAGMMGSVDRHSATSSSKTHSFITKPSFHVPWIGMTGKDTDTRSGDIFLSTQNSGQNAAYALSPSGDLIWYHPTASTKTSVFNTRVQTYLGHRVLTYWQGAFYRPPGSGKGEGVILNNSYHVIHTVHAGDGYTGIDSHEFTLVPGGKAFVSVWKPVSGVNLRSVGGPQNGSIFDWTIQEIDVATGKVLWEWNAYGHVPITATYNHYIPGRPLEYFHLNSIQLLPDGHTLIISARNTWTVYSIEMRTGKINWELGGKHSSFKMGSGTRFYWQHHATMHPGSLLTVFDDGASPAEQKESHALEIRLNMHKHTATLAHGFTHTPPVLATSEGSVQILHNHNVFVGWGSAPYFSEYTPSGKQIFSGSFSSPIVSYRAYRFAWTGTPTWSPSIAVRRTPKANQYTVYASWNGATQVAHWQVLGASSKKGPFKPIKRVRWASFETHTIIFTRDSYFELQAEGARYKVLRHGTSAVVRAGS